MDLSKKASKNLKKNLYLSLCLCIACTVFLLVGLSSMTWALFSSEYSSVENTISTASVKLSLSLKKLNKKPLLLSAKNSNDDKENGDLIHLIQITENGDYEISINVDGTTSGYCTVNITSNDEILLSKNIKVNLDEKSIKFNVHTNKKLNIEITNINWGNLESYDELDNDYYFGSYNVIYKSNIVSKLPKEYVELLYIESDGEQYTDDIKVNDDIIVTFVDHIDEETGEITYKKDIFEDYIVKNSDLQETIHLVPCYEKQTNKEGIYDLLNDIFYENKSDTPFIRGYEEFNYCYDGLDFLSVEGELPEKQTYDYGILNENKISNCELSLSGFNFVGYKYNDELIDLDDIDNLTIEELFNVQELEDNEDIILEAVFKRDTYNLAFDEDTDNIVEVTYYEAVNDIEIPSKDGYQFLGYFDENENKLFDDEGKFTSYKWTTLLENKQEVKLHSNWQLIETEGSIDNE